MNMSFLLSPMIPALAAASALLLTLTPATLPSDAPRALRPIRTPVSIPGSTAPIAQGLQIPVDILRVIDGDTLEVRARLWPDLAMTTRLRLRGIDAPEQRGSCDHEHLLAEQATRRVESLVATGQWLMTNVSRDKFGGRMVGRLVSSGGIDISDQLLAEGLARRYEGRGKRQGWC
jgi:endonuclease YncB( thermonuclease family)